MDWTWFHKFGSPPHVYRLAGTLTPWFAWPAGILIIAAVAVDQWIRKVRS